MKNEMLKPNLGWVDWLRVVACFLVVFSHCCDGFVAEFDNDRNSFVVGVLLGSAVRPCVPLFVMMTAVLLLPVPSGMEISAFYRKRVGRLVVPLAFWSMVLPLAFYLYFNTFGATTHNPAIPLDTYSADNLWNKIVFFVLNFNFDTTPLWYLYMLIGVYLIMPIISSWLEGASKNDILVVLKVWGVSLLLPYVKLLAPLFGYSGNYGNMNILGGCDWSDYTAFYYISGFVGYLILVYYLKKYPYVGSWKKLLSWGLPMFLFGYLVTSFGYIYVQNFFPGNYAYLEILWWFCGVNVFMMTLPVFLVFQKWNPRGGRAIRFFAKLTFGIYLCHFIVVQISYDLFDVSGIPVFFRIICMALTSFVFSAFVSALFSLTKFTSRFVK